MPNGNPLGRPECTHPASNLAYSTNVLDEIFSALGSAICRLIAKIASCVRPFFNDPADLSQENVVPLLGRVSALASNT